MQILSPLFVINLLICIVCDDSSGMRYLHDQSIGISRIFARQMPLKSFRIYFIHVQIGEWNGQLDLNLLRLITPTAVVR